MKRLTILLAAALFLAAGCATMTTTPASGPRLMLSGNDGKLAMIDGTYKVADPPVPDTLSVLDVSTFPPRKISEIEIQHTVTAPPMTLAITPDEKLALVSAPNRVDPKDKTKVATDTYMQVVDLESNPPRIIDKVQLDHHPLGVSVSRAGTLALAAHQNGNVSVMTIEGKSVKRVDTVKVGEPSSSPRMVAITPDGKRALVGKRGDHAVGVLAIDGNKVTYTKRDIGVGNNPYGLEVANDGTYAAVANVGNGDGGYGSVTLIDLRREPFRAVRHFTVGISPEGIAISPDGKWIAISAQSGSNRLKTDPFRSENSRVELYAIDDFKATKVGEAFAGHNIQGVVFTPDGKYLVAQSYVEKELAVYRVTAKGPEDTGHRIPVPGYPAGLRTATR